MARTSRALKGIVVALCVLCTVAAATAGGVCYFVMVAAPSPASPGVVPVTIAEDIPVVIAPDRTDQQQAGKTKRAMPRKPRVQREHAAVDELLAAGVEAGRKVRVGRKPAVVPVDDILAAGMQGARKSTTPGPRRRASSGSPASSGQPTVDEDERDDRTGEVALINSVY